MAQITAVDHLSLKSLFCAKFGCSPTEYEERAFRKCLYWHARFPAPFWGPSMPSSSRRISSSFATVHSRPGWLRECAPSHRGT